MNKFNQIFFKILKAILYFDIYSKRITYKNCKSDAHTVLNHVRYILRSCTVSNMPVHTLQKVNWIVSLVGSTQIKVKRQHLILIFMLCFQIFWHPVMNSLSHWFEIFFNLWLTPSWCNKKTRWNGLLKSILAMLPKGEITFEKVDSSFQLWFSGLFEIQNQYFVSSLSFSHFLFMIKLSQLTT